MRELDTLIRARYPLLYLVSWEEQRLDSILEELAGGHGKSFHVWSITGGLRKVAGARPSAPADGTRDPGDALRAIAALPDPALVVLKDFHPYLNDPPSRPTWSWASRTCAREWGNRCRSPPR